MSSVYPLQSSFTNGEISPLLASRVDVDMWRTSLAYCRNFQILSHGGIRRRSGSRFIAELRDSSSLARLFPFRFSEEQSYVLAFNDGYIRFLAQRGVVGSPYQISHPYGDSDLKRISYAQFNDVAYLAHSEHEPKKLLRQGDTNWTLANAVFKDGPYLPTNTTATKLTPASRGSAVPIMTAANTPSGTVTSSSGTGWYAFDGNSATYWEAAADSGVLTYTFPAGVTRVVDAYWIKTITVGDPSAPTAWTFEGYDGANWVVLDSRQGESGWGRGETRFYEFNNQTAYEAYRIAITGSENPNNLVYIVETGWHERAEDQTAFNLTASSTTGINGGAGFQATDVGRAIKLLGSDGRWRWAKIISYVSSTVVTVQMYGHALPGTSPISQWALGAFSSHSGFPAAVSLFNERVMWARTDTEPVTVYGSKQGNFEEYGVSDPAVETDGLKITLLSSNMNEIMWLSDDEDLVTGSAAQIRSIGPADITQAFSATNITQKKGPNSGASYIQPLSIGGVTLYVGDGGTKIRELLMGEQNRYVAPELTVLAEHMFKTGIVDWAYAEKPDPTIYVVTGDGLLVAIAYDRDQKVLGFSRHDFGGVVENVAVISGVNEGTDDLYMVVRRTIGGQTKRYIEVLETPFDGDSMAVEDAFFVDCGLSYSGTPISTVTGLDHLEGENVKVFADGQSLSGTYKVESGQISLPGEFSKISVGLPYTSRAITLPVAGPGRDGYLFGRRVNSVVAFVDVLHSGALKVGAYGDENWVPELYDQILPEGGGMFSAPTSLKTGFIRCDMDSSWAQGQGKIVMETDDPLPLLIRAVMLQSETEP